MKKRFAFSLFIFLICHGPAIFAQGQLWGVTQKGGTHNSGVFFNMSPDGTNYSVQSSVYNLADGAMASGTLTLAANGKFYGTTAKGGDYTGGTIFEYDPATGTRITKHSFVIAQGNGYSPAKGLVQASNGKLYGMTTLGGTSNAYGTVFEFDPVTDICVQKMSFDNTTNGAYPDGAFALAPNGKLYGTAPIGGANGNGVLFEFNPATDVYTKIFDFGGANGVNPNGFLTLASNGKLYGTTIIGVGSYGVIFELDPSTHAYAVKYSFASLATGGNPAGNIIQLSNGRLYGVAGGGSGSNGVLYEFDPGTGVYTKKIDFPTTLKYAVGLTATPSGKIFGTSEQSTVSYNGAIFEYNLAANTITTRFNFTPPAGTKPRAHMAVAGNGKLYGLTDAGEYGESTLFEFDPVTFTCVKKSGLRYSSTGEYPQSGLIKGPLGRYYGVMTTGGERNQGSLYELNPANSTYYTPISFTSSSVTGHYPEGKLALANNKFYGVTRTGGAGNFGRIYEASFTTSGGTYQGVYNFTFDHSNNDSQCGLIKASNGKLYGMTSKGGVNNVGILYEYSAFTFTKKHDFNGVATGATPYADLVQAANGKLYGMTYGGGTNNLGTLFEFDITTNTFIKKHDFSATDGGNPRGSLIQATNGKLYGMTSTGGSAGAGVIFEYDLSTSTFLKLYDFDGAGGGANPYGDLTQSLDGNLYGATYYGGANNLGVLFRFDPATGTYTKLLDYNGTNGANPVAAFLYEAKMPQRITFGPLAPRLVNETFNLTATSTSGLPVTYQSYSSGVASVSGSTVTTVSAGFAEIVASQAGNAQYFAAPPVSQYQSVGQVLSQTITIDPIPVLCMGGTTSATLSATASSGLPVTFSSTNATIASVSGNTVTALRAGTVTILATQAGNGYYRSQNASKSITIYSSPCPSSAGRTTGSADDQLVLTIEDEGESSRTLSAYPNPANDDVTFRFHLPVPSYVRLRITDSMGHEIATPVDGFKKEGYHETIVNTSNIPPGVYLYTLHTEKGHEIKRLSVIK